jgi:cytidylate kinase
MLNKSGYQQCLAFINCQLQDQQISGETFAGNLRPAITISRMAGAGGRDVAVNLAEFLQVHVPGAAPWTVFDRNLVAKVLEDHHLQKRIGNFMSEKHKSLFTDMIEEMFGLHPSNWTLVHGTAETILQLAKMGNVIIVGRGGNIVTRGLENVFHVRLVGSFEKRVKHVEDADNLDHDYAVELIKHEDNGRKRYLRENYHKDIDDPLLYHLIINTDRINHEAAAHLIGEAVIHRFHLKRHDRSGQPSVSQQKEE